MDYLTTVREFLSQSVFTADALRYGKFFGIGCLGIYVTGITGFTVFTRLWQNSLFSLVIRSKKNLKGYYIIVTGSNQGIGFETAKYLVDHGAHVVLACRSKSKGTKAETKLNAESTSDAVYNGGRAEYMQLDLSSLSSTKSFIAAYKEKKYPLHILINNAGIAPEPKITMSEDGIESVWQTNYLSHFLLCHELMPVMIKSSVENESFDCRIVNVSSTEHIRGCIDIDALKSDLETQQQKRTGFNRTYGDSKLAQIMQATYFQREILDKNDIAISACSVHPGAVRTNIFSLGWIAKLMVLPVWYFGMRDTKQGSLPTIYCAVAPIGDHKTTWGGHFKPGGYHENMIPYALRDKKQQSADMDEMKALYEYSLEALLLKPRLPDDYRTLKEREP